MRPGQNKRMRGGRPNNNNGGGNRKGPNPLTRSYESNGPDVKIRGNAHHVAEKYLQLARDAQSSGDPVAAESYLQHAEHYFRLIASAQAAQAGYARQPDAVDTEGEDDDDSGIPDRFASPQAAAPVPFVPQAAPQPYGGERQPYAERQPYGDRQNGSNGQGGERQPYGGQGDRQPYNDRNTYGRQDRNNPNRRPYRDNNGGETRADDRQPGPFNSQNSQSLSNGQNAPTQQGQDRPYTDRQSRRERFAQERLERQERQANQAHQMNGGANGQDRGQERSFADRGYDRPGDGERYRVAQAPDGAEQSAEVGGGEQPRIDQPRIEPTSFEQPRFEAATETQPEVQRRPDPEQQPDSAPAFEAQPEVASRRAEAPRRRERVATPPPADDAPGLPSFITAPPRPVASVQPLGEAATVEPSLATATPFPGDDADDAPKFPRRRRRTTRATAEGPSDAGATTPGQPVSDD